MVGLGVGVVIDILLYDSFLKKKDIVQNPHGDAAFETNYKQYDREFVLDPNIIERKLGRELRKSEFFYNDDDGHKRVYRKRVKKPIHKACYKNTQIYSQNVALSINGKWCQRNSNALIFGASGAGVGSGLGASSTTKASALFVA